MSEDGPLVEGLGQLQLQQGAEQVPDAALGLLDLPGSALACLCQKLPQPDLLELRAACRASMREEATRWVRHVSYPLDTRDGGRWEASLLCLHAALAPWPRLASVHLRLLPAAAAASGFSEPLPPALPPATSSDNADNHVWDVYDATPVAEALASCPAAVAGALAEVALDTPNLVLGREGAEALVGCGVRRVRWWCCDDAAQQSLAQLAQLGAKVCLSITGRKPGLASRCTLEALEVWPGPARRQMEELTLMGQPQGQVLALYKGLRTLRTLPTDTLDPVLHPVCFPASLTTLSVPDLRLSLADMHRYVRTVCDHCSALAHVCLPLITTEEDSPLLLRGLCERLARALGASSCPEASCQLLVSHVAAGSVELNELEHMLWRTGAREGAEEGAVEGVVEGAVQEGTPPSGGPALTLPAKLGRDAAPMVECLLPLRPFLTRLHLPAAAKDERPLPHTLVDLGELMGPRLEELLLESNVQLRVSPGRDAAAAAPCAPLRKLVLAHPHGSSAVKHILRHVQPQSLASARVGVLVRAPTGRSSAQFWASHAQQLAEERTRAQLLQRQRRFDPAQQQGQAGRQQQGQQQPMDWYAAARQLACALSDMRGAGAWGAGAMDKAAGRCVGAALPALLAAWRQGGVAQLHERSAAKMESTAEELARVMAPRGRLELGLDAGLGGRPPMPLTPGLVLGALGPLARCLTTLELGSDLQLCDNCFSVAPTFPRLSKISLALSTPQLHPHGLAALVCPQLPALTHIALHAQLHANYIDREAQAAAFEGLPPFSPMYWARTLAMSLEQPLLLLFERQQQRQQQQQQQLAGTGRGGGIRPVGDGALVVELCADPALQGEGALAWGPRALEQHRAMVRRVRGEVLLRATKAKAAAGGGAGVRVGGGQAGGGQQLLEGKAGSGGRRAQGPRLQLSCRGAVVDM